MAQYHRDFTEYEVGATFGSGIDDIFPLNDASDGTASIVATDISASGRGLENVRSGFTDETLFAMSFIEKGHYPRGEIYIEYYGTSTLRQTMSAAGGCYLRDDAITGHTGGVHDMGGGNNYGNTLKLFVNGTISDSTSPASDFVVYTSSEDMNRLRVIIFRWEEVGGAVVMEVSSRFKDEPFKPVPLLTRSTDTALVGEIGWLGFGRLKNSNVFNVFTFVGVGTDGDPAPTGFVEVSAEPFQLRHNPRTNKVIPVLSAPTVTDIGANCVRPRVTKGY